MSSIAEYEAVLKETIERTQRRREPVDVPEAEQFYNAKEGEILGCCSCGAQVRVDYEIIGDDQAPLGRYCIPMGFVYFAEGIPELDEGTEEIINTPPLHMCNDCFRVFSGLTEDEIAEIMDETKRRVNSGVDDPIALSEACQVWAATNLPVAGNEPEVWIVIEEQVKEWMIHHGMEVWE